MFLPREILQCILPGGHVPGQIERSSEYPDTALVVFDECTSVPFEMRPFISIEALAHLESEKAPLNNRAVQIQRT